MAIRKAKPKTPRQLLNEALSKALAYYMVGNHSQAKIWTKILVSRLADMGLIDRPAVDGSDKVT